MTTQDEEEEDEEEVEWMTDTSAAAQAARAAEQLTGATADMVTQGNIEARSRYAFLEHAENSLYSLLRWPSEEAF